MKNINIQTANLIKTHLHKKIDADLILPLARDEKLFSLYANQIQQAIEMFNSLRTDNPNLNINRKFLLNTSYLIEIFDSNLPNYLEVIEKLLKNQELRNAVFTELTESDYFQEVWKIENKEYLVINIMILLYRTSMLHLYPELKTKKAQISSTIEEMAAILHREQGRCPNLFSAVKHWIADWNGEGFSKEFSDYTTI